MIQSIDTLIIGGGQGGLATSYYLKQQGREHLILEQSDQAGSAWRDGRWDSFTLVTPNWAFRLPGAEYAGDDPAGFLDRDQVVEIFAGYADKFGLPLRTRTRVSAVEASPEGGFLVHTQDTTYQARNVVVATGLFQAPRIPVFAERLPADVVQLHSGDYRNPDQLPEGGVLVVGSSQSGCQIAQELHQSGRPVYLCTSGAGRIPRTYRGRDIFAWAALMGFSDRTVDQLPSPRAKFAANPHMAGKSDGGSLNLHQFARDGIRLLGRLQNVEDGKLRLAGDLHDNLAKADKFEADMLQGIDAYIAQAGIDAPLEALPQWQDGYAQTAIDELDLAASGIRTVIWAIGYDFDFGMVKFPIFDEDGYPIQQRGATAQPGLYFVGLPWLHKQKSGLLAGVAEDAAHIAQRICAEQTCAA
ncbi:NAD(P)-binding domain-containing protein [Crenobacter sp. SG2303]|uniref:NAD(P)-binding domain-containing protein n=1 Tax=Crenobacter oryzisoli TaxID=3056844 RepID=A0ABT7XQA9_9NEIS|nr:NAD(P)-binding domain-containing protein [Crenobacter sp. SG2303]MDN0075993.1 NAD(P)-binding domain-containing protein [Crenobacter sp. SG2303]